MRFGTFHLSASPGPEDDLRIINEQLEQVEAADALGFETAWLTEHNFTGDNGYGDPIPFAAALTGRTKRITLGFAVVQMALHHPIRLATQLALLDNLLGGRLVVGIGKGSAFNEYEYAGYGLRSDTARERMFEAVELLRRVWTEPNVEFHGKFFDVTVPGIRPRPLQRPHPPLALAVSSDDSIRYAAKQGLAVLFSVLSTDQLRQRLAIYTDTMAAAGWDSGKIDGNLARVSLMRTIYVADTDARARDDILEPTYTMYHSLQRNRKTFNPADHDPRKGERGNTWTAVDATADEAVADLIDRTYIVGSPDTVVRKLKLLEAEGCPNVMCRMSWGSMDHQKVLASMRLFASDVMPAFDAARLSAR